MSEEAALVGGGASPSNKAPHKLQYALEYVSSIILSDLHRCGHVMTYSGFIISIEKAEVFDGHAL